VLARHEQAAIAEFLRIVVFSSGCIGRCQRAPYARPSTTASRRTASSTASGGTAV
jgi:hypothetical protein